MGSQLDIAGSFLIAGMMLMSFNMFILDKQQAEIAATNSVIRQSNVSEATQLMMWDMRKAGYNCAPGTGMIRAQSNELRFLGDVDNNGSIDTIGYTFKAGLSQAKNKKRALMTIRLPS